MEASEEDDFYCPLCGCNLLWMPVSHIFVCEHCKESFSESAKYYLRKKEDVTEGNQQKMREALKRCEAISHFPEIREQQCVKDMRNIIAHALAAPPRNCDVGTPEEQSVRMSEFCREQYEKTDGIMLCSGCRLAGLECQLAWAQMPYTAEEGGL